MAGEIPENTVRVLDHGFVRLDDSMASDLSVVNAARVSFARRKDVMEEADEGLIRFLMRDRHGCYDEKTEVLTADGWRRWPEVTGGESFATLSPTGELEYQPALRVVHKEIHGPMVGFKGASVDLRVTPDHRVLASTLTTRDGREGRAPFGLRPALDVLWKAHRHVATAAWDGVVTPTFRFDGVAVAAEPFLRLVGFFIGDGHLPPASHIQFNIRKEREIRFLERTAFEAGLDLRLWGKTRCVRLTPGMRAVFERCYLDREKVIPRELLALSPRLLSALFEGLLESDGTVQERRGVEPRLTYYTTSRRLADDVQELALKMGRSASVRPHATHPGDGHYGAKPRFRVTIYSLRNSRPALCRTRAASTEQMDVEPYDGTVHCVEVPNGTLYVRRNGYPVWSGNTPFEHNAFRFHIRSPIFVAREWMRHRVGSFNEFSMRYAKATDEFYVPDADDVRSQVGKPGAYTFEPVSPELAEQAREEIAAVYEQAYATYERLVEAGVARELARSVMPVGAYTEFFWTINARSLMNFVSLRAAETAQREIRRYADACEQFLAERMPVTHAAFVAAGRVAP
jgi:thymidylate synthase (FAD)